MTENTFPYVIHNNSGLKDITAAIDWLTAESTSLKSDLSITGALLFRGFPIKSAEDFDAFSSAFNYGNFTYQESLSNSVRINKTPKVFTANEAPPDVEIFLHHEMAQTPIHPEKIFFCCLSPAEQGGATPLCQSDKVYEALNEEHPEWVSKFERLGLKYTTLMPDFDELTSGQGRGWRSTLSVQDKSKAEDKLKELGYTWEWQENGSLLATSPSLPAITELPDGRKSFFNQVIAAYRGWKRKEGTASPVVTFGNGEQIDEAILNTVIDIASRFTSPLKWEAGDVALVDNKRVMHGRYPYSGLTKREVVVCLAKD
jgi:alpha-ketoglutarate-dependent taurine dioxygenase